MRAIAASAGVSRQALYRRFASKQEALLAALVAAGQEQIVVRPTGSLDRDLARFLTKTFSALRRVEAPMRALVAQAQMDRASRTALRERLIASRRDALRTLLEHHLRGDDPVRIDLLIDIAFGVMWYRFLIGHAPLSPALARDLAALIAGSS